MSSVINVRLNERMTVRFVELYRDERLLWDKEHESYNKRSERLRAYQRIVDGMAVDGLGVPEVASKIKNIRSTYMQELKKIKDSAQRHLVQSEEEDAVASPPYVPKLLWFPILDSMIGEAAVKRLYSSPQPSVMLSVDYVEEEQPPVSFPTLEYSYNNYAANNDGEAPFRRKRTSSCDDYPASIKHYSYEQQQSSSELFAKYIATSVETLPPRLAIQAQKELHDVLIKYKLMECDQDQKR